MEKSISEKSNILDCFTNLDKFSKNTYSVTEPNCLRMIKYEYKY